MNIHFILLYFTLKIKNQKYLNLLMGVLKTVLSGILLLGIILLGAVQYQLYFSQKFQITDNAQAEEITAFTKYQIDKSGYWPERFKYKQSSMQKRLSYSCEKNNLQIQGGYMMSYQCSDLDALISVQQYFGHQKSTEKHFVFKYHNYVEVYSISKSTKNQGKLCTGLDVDQHDNYVYFTGLKNDLWIISYPNNNLIFIQVYDCQSKQLLKRIFHQPKSEGENVMINEIYEVSHSIKKQQNQLVKITGSTYNMHCYQLQINAHNFQVFREQIIKSHKIIRQNILLKSQGSAKSGNQISYNFIDAENYLMNIEYQKVMDNLTIWFLEKVKDIMKAFSLDVNWLIKLMRKQKIKDEILDYENFNMEVFNPFDNCLIALNINKTSSLIGVEPYMTNTKTPLFHSVQNLQDFDIISVLKKQIKAPTNQFKRLSLNTNFAKQIETFRFQTVHRLQPESSVQYMGIGQKLLFFYPMENLKEEEYYHVRSKVGGVILQGNKIKGAYEDRPLTHPEYEVTQLYNQNANEVLPGIFQAHVGYKHLYTDLHANRLQLVNGLNGRTIYTHYFSLKENYNYSSTFLQNNEWWIVQYNSQTKLSYAVKYELFVNREKIKQVMGVKRVYGKMDYSEFQEGQDNLAEVLKKFNNKYNKGFLILNIFKCIDEFYYIEFTDSEGQHYGLSRIHFKKLSNRHPKISNVYSGQLQKDLQVAPKDMIKQKERMEPFGVILENVQVFKSLILKKQLFNINSNQVGTKQKCDRFALLQKTQPLSVIPCSIILNSHYNEQCSQNLYNKVPKSESISVVDMRGLIIKVKNRQVGQYKSRVKSFLLASVFALLLIFSCLLIKINLKKPVEGSKASENAIQSNSPKKAKKEAQKKKN